MTTALSVAGWLVIVAILGWTVISMWRFSRHQEPDPVDERATVPADLPASACLCAVPGCLTSPCRTYTERYAHR